MEQRLTQKGTDMSELTIELTQNARIREIEAQLAAAENSRDMYLIKADTAEAERNGLAARLEASRSARRQAQAQLAEANARAASLRESVETQEGVISNLLDENASLRAALQGMLDWYEDAYGEGFCECDSTADLICRACVARAVGRALASRREPKAACEEAERQEGDKGE